MLAAFKGISIVFVTGSSQFDATVSEVDIDVLA